MWFDATIGHASAANLPVDVKTPLQGAFLYLVARGESNHRHADFQSAEARYWCDRKGLRQISPVSSVNTSSSVAGRMSQLSIASSCSNRAGHLRINVVKRLRVLLIECQCIACLINACIGRAKACQPFRGCYFQKNNISYITTAPVHRRQGDNFGGF